MEWVVASLAHHHKLVNIKSVALFTKNAEDVVPHVFLCIGTQLWHPLGSMGEIMNPVVLLIEFNSVVATLLSFCAGKVHLRKGVVFPF